jgi:hypothetical protein
MRASAAASPRRALRALALRRCSPRLAGLGVALLCALAVLARRLGAAAHAAAAPPPARFAAPNYAREPGAVPPSRSCDVAFVHDAPPAGESLEAFAPERELPLLAVFVRAGTAFLARFAESVDFPVRELLVVQDGASDARVTRGVEALAARLAGPGRKIARVRHVVNARHTGCAEGESASSVERRASSAGRRASSAGRRAGGERARRKCCCLAPTAWRPLTDRHLPCAPRQRGTL